MKIELSFNGGKQSLLSEEGVYWYNTEIKRDKNEI